MIQVLCVSCFWLVVGVWWLACAVSVPEGSFILDWLGFFKGQAQCAMVANIKAVEEEL